MTVNINMPKPTDRPSASVGEFVMNWTGMNSFFGIDHIPFNATKDNGEHKKVTFNDVAVDPLIGTLKYPKSELYTKHNPATGTNVFFAANNSTDAVQTIRQLTNLVATTYAQTGQVGGTTSYIDTPWGIRMFWGTTANFSGNSKTLIIPNTSGTFLTAVFTPNNVGPTYCAARSLNPTTIEVSTSTTQSLMYIILTQLP
jgi:hypothetical protein